MREPKILQEPFRFKTDQHFGGAVTVASTSPTQQLKLNSVALVRNQTIQIERPPLVGEVTRCRVVTATDLRG
jgi:hypothetical protein